MRNTQIPEIVISRLPVYLRALSRMAAEGQEVTSSQELGGRLGISSAQIRKDLSHFGEFGKQGTGYSVKFLAEKLRQILKVDSEWEVALVGVGDLGHALLRYNGFRDRGFRIVAAYDADPAKVGMQVSEMQVQAGGEMVEDVKRRGLKVAMLAVPADGAQAVTEQLVEAGIQAILTYAPVNLGVPDGVRVQYIDPVVHLQRMTYYL